MRENLGTERSRNIDFGKAWLLCVAREFRREDVISAETNTRRIDLLIVRRLGEASLLLEWAHGGEKVPGTKDGDEKARRQRRHDARSRAAREEPPVVMESDFGIYQRWDKADTELRGLFMDLHRFVIGLGKNVQVKPVRKYISYKRKRNMVDVQFRTQKKLLIAAVALDPETVPMQTGFTRDVSKIGYPSPNNLEITIRNRDALERAKPLIKRSYDETG